MSALRERPRVGSPRGIQAILEGLRKAESAEMVRDRRSAERTPLVRPVLISLGRGQETKIQATSRDLSRTGICLIHDISVEVRRMGILTIYRLHEEPVQLRADVRWCEPFCGSWFISGWRFLAAERR